MYSLFLPSFAYLYDRLAEHWQLGTIETYNYINTSGCTVVPQLDSKIEYGSLKRMSVFVVFFLFFSSECCSNGRVLLMSVMEYG